MANFTVSNVTAEVIITKPVYENNPVLLRGVRVLNFDLTGVTTIEGKYRKPDGTEGTFTNNGVINTPTAQAGGDTFDFQIAQNELDQARGSRQPWTIWFTISGVTDTDPLTLNVLKAGNIT
jgi:hypothetical protein